MPELTSRTVSKALRTSCLGTMALMIALCGQTSRARAEELVKFESAPYVLGQVQQRQAIERGETVAKLPTTIEGYLSKPDGAGPFPAIVYLHGCSGLSSTTRARIGALLTGWGYVSLAVDSFTSRGIKEACHGGMPPRQADALGALLYLSSLPSVDAKRIAVVGSSQGGIVALRLASTQSIKLFDIPDDLKFKAAVAYYPLCGVASKQLALPTIILIGELDDWTPAIDCERWMALRAANGAPVKLVVYPGAYHAFDVPTLRAGIRLFGHWLKYDADAAARSISEMHDFLASQLSN
ncbi:MAG TPA: dienelactone hydrolase family protein [Bradyrhizobium sp.]|uniref:dienelactone hydrolase family protein n=1 Tax=Bradyrhizobium sp. TaxID=376 RepID=UPI002B4A3E46|nr:dienelactone hydrolase family protein [Bradyrhizobium sp.]HKO69984.1 dienelactone hydrolase family protein [Bradyrhizobium sp.]